LVIPYLSRSGVVAVRFRCLEPHNCKEVGCPKYLSVRGDKPTLYNTEALFSAGSVIAITEGELDAVVITEYAGIPAVGIQGVSAWNDVFARTLNDFDRVLIVGDADDAGKQMVDRLVDSVPSAVGVSLPDGLDANDVYLEYGADELAMILGTA
jgi:DNA primase